MSQWSNFVKYKGVNFICGLDTNCWEPANNNSIIHCIIRKSCCEEQDLLQQEVNRFIGKPFKEFLKAAKETISITDTDRLEFLLNHTIEWCGFINKDKSEYWEMLVNYNKTYTENTKIECVDAAIKYLKKEGDLNESVE